MEKSTEKGKSSEKPIEVEEELAVEEMVEEEEPSKVEGEPSVVAPQEKEEEPSKVEGEPSVVAPQEEILETQQVLVADIAPSTHADIEGEQVSEKEATLRSRKRKAIIMESDSEEEEDVILPPLHAEIPAQVIPEVDEEEEEARMLGLSVEQLREGKLAAELIAKQSKDELESQKLVQKAAREEKKKAGKSAIDPIKLQQELLVKASEEIRQKKQEDDKLRADLDRFLNRERKFPEKIIKVVIHITRDKLTPSYLELEREGRPALDFVKLIELKSKLSYSEMEEIYRLVRKSRHNSKMSILQRLDEVFAKIRQMQEYFGLEVTIPNIGAEKQPSAAPSSKKRKTKEEKEAEIKMLQKMGTLPNTKNLDVSLPEGVEFQNGKVISSPEYGIFFRDKDQNKCFQRVSQIPLADPFHLVAMRWICKGQNSDPNLLKIIEEEIEKRDILVNHEMLLKVKQEMME